ncbi:hypothetical protein [Steroidobacter denitrificans]|uniref:hypothetical protein n=1 Tax=Steroidobacter denitrificans TaxID=465721 RepID=UPI001AEF4D58|nr:hypothetical protein [Steroidobacter denitrificans]
MPVRTLAAWLWLLAATAWIAGCDARLTEPRLGAYRAVLELPGGEMPFGLEITRERDRYALYLSNGEERTRIDEVQLTERELIAQLSNGAEAPFENSTSLASGNPPADFANTGAQHQHAAGRTAGGDRTLRVVMRRKRLDGQLIVIQPDGARQRIPFRATLGETHRFYVKSSTDNADVSGHWAMTFTNGDGRAMPALAMLVQSHDHVTGNIETSDEYQSVDGQVHGDELRLASFTGGTARLYHLKVNQAGDLQGEFWQDLQRHEQIDARRAADATLDDG